MFVGPREGISFSDKDGSNLRIGIVNARWNKKIIDGLIKGVEEGLRECNVPEENITRIDVPGSFEVPLATRLLAMSGRVDAIVALGCLFKGETLHFETIADAVVHGLMKVQLETLVPVVYGVLTCFNNEQAVVRSSGETNNAFSWGQTAVEMAKRRRSALGARPAATMGFEASGIDSTLPSSTAQGAPVSSSKEGTFEETIDAREDDPFF